MLAAAAPGVALFGLHGLVGIHVVRTELTKLAGWFRIDRRAVVWGVAGGAFLLAFNGPLRPRSRGARRRCRRTSRRCSAA